jgi:hypothetical protein
VCHFPSEQVCAISLVTVAYTILHYLTSGSVNGGNVTLSNVTLRSQPKLGKKNSQSPSLAKMFRLFTHDLGCYRDSFPGCIRVGFRGSPSSVCVYHDRAQTLPSYMLCCYYKIDLFTRELQLLFYHYD